MYRVNKNITIYTLFLSLEDYIASPWGDIYFRFVSLGNVLANELAKLFLYKPGCLKESRSVSMWRWKESHYYTPNSNSITRFFEELWMRCKALLKAFISFAILSTVTGFVFRMGIMASSVLLIICRTSFNSLSQFRSLVWRS
jgi:hypothetical protein